MWYVTNVLKKEFGNSGYGLCWRVYGNQKLMTVKANWKAKCLKVKNHYFNSQKKCGTKMLYEPCKERSHGSKKMTYETDIRHDSYLAPFKISKEMIFQIAMDVRPSVSECTENQMAALALKY